VGKRALEKQKMLKKGADRGRKGLKGVEKGLKKWL